MKKLFFVLLILINCSEQDKIEIRNYTNCFKMITLSDSNSIQFWVNGQPTFNQKIEDGVEHICFYQPFNASDKIKLQFLSSVGGIKLQLVVYNTSNVELNRLDLDEIITGVYQLQFTPEDDLGITNQLIKFALVQHFEIASLADWINHDPGVPSTNWVLGANPSVNLTILRSKDIIGEFLGLEGEEYSFQIKINGPDADHLLTVKFLKDDFTDAGSIDIGVGDSSIDGVFAGTPTADTKYISVAISNGDALAGAFDIETFDLVEVEDLLLAYSDFIEIKENHRNTRLIQVSNEEDYDNLVYEGIDPTPNFAIRVKCKFVKEREPEENESEPLSSGEVIKLLGTTKKQKLIQVEPAPYYWHTKIRHYLQHNTCYINNQRWLKEDVYETKELNERFPFEVGETWLTLQDDSYVANPFGG